MKHKNGNWIWVIDRGKINKWDIYGNPLIMSGTHQDITKRKHSEEELRKKADELAISNHALEQYAFANQELKQFAYTASHQLQEPIRTVSNYMKIIKEDYSQILDIKALHYIQIVDEALVRMGKLINSLLVFSRLGRNKKLVNVDCRKLIDNVIADVSFMVETSKATIDVGNMPVLNLYEPEVRQLFQNLITNAIKFQSKDTKPEIRIRSERRSNYWEFSVSDNGIGIDSVHFERIFDIFQRLHINEEVYEGQGIGLTYCKKIVNLHHGEIWVESNIGKGTTFYFTLKILND
jgi:light-regulated signal transduction histidine kinase (bacteriophytochrome)